MAVSGVARAGVATRDRTNRAGPVAGRNGGGPPGGTMTGIDCVVGGSRPTVPVWWPTSKVISGPSGLPMLTDWPSEMSTVETRWPLTNTPFSELLSTAIHLPWSKRNSRCARATSGCATRRSARTSLPTTTSRPAAKLPCDRPDRTVSTGCAGRFIEAQCRLSRIFHQTRPCSRSHNTREHRDVEQPGCGWCCQIGSLVGSVGPSPAVGVDRRRRRREAPPGGCHPRQLLEHRYGWSPRSCRRRTPAET